MTRTGLDSQWSSALATRLRRIRSTRLESTSAMTGSSGMSISTSTPAASAMWATVPTASLTAVRTSSSAVDSSAMPASWRETSSRSVSRLSKRSSSDSSSSTARLVGASRSSAESEMMSAAIRTVVSGVRSSWETSEVNRFCRSPNSSSWVIWSDRLWAMSLNAMARRATSSSPRMTIRSLRWPLAKRWAIEAACRTGSTTCRATIHAIAADSTMIARPAVATIPRMMPRVCSSAMSGYTR